MNCVHTPFEFSPSSANVDNLSCPSSFKRSISLKLKEALCLLVSWNRSIINDARLGSRHVDWHNPPDNEQRGCVCMTQLCCRVCVFVVYTDAVRERREVIEACSRFLRCVRFCGVWHGVPLSPLPSGHIYLLYHFVFISFICLHCQHSLFVL